MPDLKQQHQRPEGALIEKALKGPPKMSMRELARRVEMSDARVRQIINGYQPQGEQVIRVKGPAETVARLAMAVGLTADDLEGAGRSDVADHIRAAENEYPGRPEMAEATLQTNAIFQEMKEWLLNAPNGLWPGAPPTSGLSFWSSEALLHALMEREEGRRETNQWHVRRYEKLREKYDALVAKGGDGHDADELADRRAPSMNDDQDIDEAIAALEDQDNPPGAPEE